ncbi:MAG: hypothetical protein RIB60_06400 [Phycisphaerales bacterium]
MNDGDMIMRDHADPIAPSQGGEGANIFVDLEGRAGPEPASGFGGKSGKFGNQTIVLLVLLVLSAGAVYGMRRVGIVSGISGQALAVEYQPSAINAEFERRFERAMDDLARSGRPIQVALEDLPDEPFNIDQRLSLATMAIAEVDPATLSEQQRLRAEAQRAEEERRRLAAMRERIDVEAARLKVQSMIGGRVPVATINGQLCRAGDQVGNGIFTVESITGEGVTVSASGRRFLVPMGKPAQELFE